MKLENHTTKTSTKERKQRYKLIDLILFSKSSTLWKIYCTLKQQKYLKLTSNSSGKTRKNKSIKKYKKINKNSKKKINEIETKSFSDNQS